MCHMCIMCDTYIIRLYFYALHMHITHVLITICNTYVEHMLCICNIYVLPKHVLHMLNYVCNGCVHHLTHLLHV